MYEALYHEAWFLKNACDSHHRSQVAREKLRALFITAHRRDPKHAEELRLWSDGMRRLEEASHDLTTPLG